MILENEKFIQHIQEENTPEFKKFKQISDEDSILANLIKEHIVILDNAKILDVGGREGYVSLQIGRPENITIVDCDPLVHPDSKIEFIRGTIQDTDLHNKYDLIISSHIWGDLNREEVDADTLNKLYGALIPNGSLIICYNSNINFMKDLFEFAKSNLQQMRYDYFDESLVRDMKYKKISFTAPLRYTTFEELGRCCWMLFATAFDDIKKTSKIFVPFLEKKLNEPTFELEQTVIIISKT